MKLIPEWLERRAERWEELSRWERTEVGRELRRLGLSYGEIMEIVPVPKGTLAGWCRHITITADQAAAIKARTGSVAGVPRDTQWRRRMEIATIRREARLEAAALVHEPLWTAGTSLYWGEGSKSSRSLGLANSDVRVLRLFIRWVRAFHNSSSEFVLKLNLHADNDELAARHHWAAALDLQDADFYRTFIKPDGTGHRKNHLPQGVCTVRVRKSADAWIRTMAWIDWLADELTETATLPGGSLAQFGRAGAS